MNKQRGFTLLELIIAIVGVGTVIALICVLVVATHFIAKAW